MSTPTNARFHLADAVFDAALDLPTREQVEYVRRECGDDDSLRAEVLELLAAHHRSAGFLDMPAVKLEALFGETAVLGEGTPNRIGPFRIVREIGAGGMGQVFLGERADGQFEQRVALKLIRHAIPGLVRRFLDERRILAMLEHPRIARLIDGGITADGLPYFAMEYVEGVPIDRYCHERNLSLDARLRLFADVCDAVSYAHHHLVIHRDLKPSNILVTADGGVKLLDFGIAKLLDPRRAALEETRTEFRAMTPEFAAPEQVRGGSVSTATDVYSLGVLLYMLLTGERPYDLRGKSLAEIERTICDYEPPRPSGRAPASQRRRLRGDLDLIVMTALQKQDARRYQSPAALAEDLQRFRDGRPIVARADSAPYRLGKFVGRHRTGLVIAAGLLMAFSAAMSRERALRDLAETEARKANAVEEFLVRVFEVSDPYAVQARDGGSVTARELLDRGAARIDSTLTGQPEVQAELRGVLGRVYANLGLFDKATPLLRRSLEQRRALGHDSPVKLAAAMDQLGATLVMQSRYDEADPLLREALAQRRRLLGNADTATATSLERLATLYEEQNRYAAAEPLRHEALAIRTALLGDSSKSVAESLSDLGLLHFRKGEYERAEPLYRRALAVHLRTIGENHPTTAVTMQNLAQTLQMRGQLAEAERYFRRSLAAKRKALGDAHPSVTIGLNNLGNLLARVLGRLEEGEALAREALALDRKIFGERHSYVAQSLANLGVILALQGEFAEAERLLRRAADINRELFGGAHQALANNYGYLAQIRHQLGDDREAERLAREAYAQYRAKLGPHHPNTLVMSANLARILTETGRPAEAERLLREALGKLDSTDAGKRATFVSARRGLGEALLAQGRATEAVPLLAQALVSMRTQFGDTSWRTAQAQLSYGSALLATRRYDEAEPVLRAAHETLRRQRKSQPRLTRRAEVVLAQLATRRP